jgi:hypothetical protein
MPVLNSFPNGIRTYAEYLASPLWHSIRARVRIRDQHTCQCCGREAVCVHHIDYHAKTLRGKRLTSLISLCGECHADVEWAGGKRVLDTRIKYQLLVGIMRERRGISMRAWRTGGKRRPPKRAARTSRRPVSRSKSDRNEPASSDPAVDERLAFWRGMEDWQRRNWLAAE